MGDLYERLYIWKNLKRLNPRDNVRPSMAKSKNYQEFLLELKDHDEAVAYLNAALEKSLKGDEES